MRMSENDPMYKHHSSISPKTKNRLSPQFFEDSDLGIQRMQGGGKVDPHHHHSNNSNNSNNNFTSHHATIAAAVEQDPAAAAALPLKRRPRRVLLQ